MLPSSPALLGIATLLYHSSTALPNGLATVPEMGFNSWYALHGHLTYPNYTWVPGYVVSDDMLLIAQWFIDNGLQAVGYDYMNMDDAIVWERDATGALVPDPQAFPHGVSNFSSALHSMGFKVGWYTDRGQYTCSCYAGGWKRPGSLGHEAQDAATYASWGIDYLKDDSCFAPSNGTAFQEYGAQRDGLNATGRPIFFNMCWGAGATIANVGRQYGNGWRIAEDDGAGWTPILVNVDVNAGLYNCSGCDGLHHDGFGCGWNDMGLLLVGDRSLTDDQARSHFNLWSIMANKLLISQDPRNFTATDLETVKNVEVIMIDQDMMGVQGRRLVPPVNMTRWSEDRARVAAARVPVSNAAHPDGTFTLPRSHAHKYGVVNPNFTWVLEAVEGTRVAEVRAAGGELEVWARPLVAGRWAVLFFNNGVNGSASITCGQGCWDFMGWKPTQAVAVRDVWSHTDNGTVTGSLTVTGIATDASVMVILS